MEGTITLFVEPKSLPIFLEVMNVLEHLPLDNSYTFQPTDIIFEITTVSNWVRINIPIVEYLKLKYCIGKLS